MKRKASPIVPRLVDQRGKAAQNWPISLRWMAFLLALCFALPIRAVENVVINEIHSDPPDAKSVPAEFIELHNPLPGAVDVSGWSFTKGVTYTFPPGTSIAGRGYLVVAESPAVFQQQFHVAALGPWVGGLANEGETLELADALGAVVDRVSYGSGFPWPTVGDNGHSMQLINAALDHDLGGSWRSAPPTPGARNAVEGSNAPPQIRQVNHSPPQPASGQVVTITAKVTDPEGVQSVTLDYQIVAPGNYLRLSDAAFTNTWTATTMRDDGSGGDAEAGDGLFSVSIPASVQMHRRLIRYRINARDALGLAVRVPYLDDPTPNFAYFVYDGVPAWSGAVRPGVTAVQTFGTNTMRHVRPYHLLSRSNDVWNCQYNPSFNDGTFRFEGALVVGGSVYDHVHYRVKGQGSTFNTGKNKWKFHFNRGHWFEMPDDYGLTTTTVETLNISSVPAPWAPWNRGLAGLDEVMQYRLSNLAGVPSPRANYLQLRVIDDAVEQPANTQFDGDLWGLYLAFENQDNHFKEAHGLPDGNIFRMQITSGGNELLGQGAGQPVDLSDLNAFVSTSTGYNHSPPQPESWWRTNVDLAKYFSWRAVDEAVNNTDIRDQENVVYYRNPANGLWHIEPWDCDLLYEQFDRWGPEGVQRHTPFEQIRRCLTVTNLNIEFQNRARELQDLLLNQDQGAKLIDEYVAIITDGGPDNPGFVEVDRRRWDYNPKNPTAPDATGPVGNYYKTPYPVSRDSSRVLASADFAGCVTWVKDFISTDAHGGARLASLANDTTIPNTPTVTYLGVPGFAANRLVFQTTAFRSPAARAFRAVQWRVGEVYDPGVSNYVQGLPWRYEIETVWESGPLTNPVYTITVPVTALKVGHRYRVRAQLKDATGRSSNWSPPVEFTVGEPTGAADLLNFLRITEVMYHPPAGGFEFVELHNTSPSVTLDLSGVKFTQGIDYTFTNGVTLGPDAYLLVTKLAPPSTLADFRAFYWVAASVPVFAAFSGSLDNAGERLTLRTGAGGTDIVSFEYKDGRGWPDAADGAGHSLVLLDGLESAQGDGAGEFGGIWRASAGMRGSAGRADDFTPASLLINEVAVHTDLTGELDSNDWIELYNPTGAPLPLGAGWFLSDDGSSVSNLMNWAIPSNTVVPARGWVSFDEVAGFHFPTNIGFALNKVAASVFLSYLPGGGGGPLDRVVDSVSFKAQENDWSWGRFPDGGPFWSALNPRTRDTANPAPPAHLVISELMYHPPDFAGGTNNALDEFIEIHNPTANAVALFNTNGPWRIDGGVNFYFPPNLTVAAGAYLLVVNFNPVNTAQLAAFRATYGIAGTNPVILGPYTGGDLPNSSARVALEKPLHPDPPDPLVSWIVVDEVLYADQPPWPCGTDGTGDSLQRLDPRQHGSDPLNWTAAAPSPGGPRAPAPAGAPSILVHPPGRMVAPDGAVSFSVMACGTPPLTYQWRRDGTALAGATNATFTLFNIQWSDAGFYTVEVSTPAATASSAPAALTVPGPPHATISATGGVVTLSWNTEPGRTYRVQYRLTLGAGAWEALPGDVTATAPTAHKQDMPPSPGTQIFYRVLILP